MFVVTVKFDIKPQEWEEFLPIILCNAKASLRENECYHFDVCINEEQKKIFLYEVYADQDAFDFHLKTDHFLSFDDQTIKMIDAKEISFYQQII